MTDKIRAAAKNGRAEIFIYEDIGGDLFGDGIRAKDVAVALKTMPDAAEIDLFINSYGGSVFEGLAIFNVLRRHQARITTHIDGIAASAASVIAMAGDEIRIAANGFLMIHDAWGMAIGGGDAMRKAATDIDNATDAIAKTYASRRGTDLDRIKTWMAEETWFNADQAVAAGLVDGIADANRVAAFVKPSERFPFRHLPETLSNSIAEGVPAPTEQATEPDQEPVELKKRAVEFAKLNLTATAIRQHSAPVTGRDAAATPKAKQ